MTRKQLIEIIHQRNSFLCVGLDTDIEKIPVHLLTYDDPVFEFNRRIIDATKEYSVAYKNIILPHKYFTDFVIQNNIIL